MRYLVIGLGTYGREVACNLYNSGHEVIGVDNRETNIELVKDKLTSVYQLDSSEENALKILPLNNVDATIVAIGEDCAASLRTVAILKKNGVKNIFARAIDELHQSILEAFSVEKILTPEKRAAKDLTLELAFNAQTSSFKVSDDYQILKTQAPKKFIGHTYRSLNLNKLGLLIITAVRKTEYKNVLSLTTTKEEILDIERKADEEKVQENDFMVILGSQENIVAFMKSF